MDQEPGRAPDLPAPPGADRCYRHPEQETLVHCTRCGRPICPRCMIPAPVGHQCPTCVAEARSEFRRGPGRKLLLHNLSLTRSMIAVLAAAFLVEMAASGSGQFILGPSPQQMIRLGATDPIRMALHGQYWRLFTAMFLHYGLIHIAANCYALWILGTLVESEFGRGRWILLYLLTGLAGNVASYAFGPVSGAGAGASGAVFGLMGAFFAYNYRRRTTRIARMNIQAVVQTLILNIIITLSISFIDWRAHLGGFIAGIIAGLLLDRGPGEVAKATRVGGLLLLVLAVTALAAWRTADLRSMFGGVSGL